MGGTRKRDSVTAKEELVRRPELQGKVILVEFWTYTCINWRRQLPYVRSWADKYKEHGLVVVGVHSPEFSFERNIDNVRWAAKDMRVDYAIAVDNDRAVWRGFHNEYWPALYFADAKGRIRHSQFGEGDYEQSEKVIKKLLAEAGRGEVRNELVSVDTSGAEAQADWKDLQSGENYVGYERTENFASNASPDKPRVYSAPKHLGLNYWALSGEWTMGGEALLLNQSGTVREQRMYQLVRQRPPISDRHFEIEFIDAGVEAFSFTFG